MIKKILLAVDGSENATRATDTAAELASKLNAELNIVHVLMHGRPPAELVRMAEVEHIIEETRVATPSAADYTPRTYFDAFKTDTDSAARVITAVGEEIAARAEKRCTRLGASVATKSVRAGDYAEEILEAAQECDADLIVVGTRGLGRVRSTVLGSVSQKVLHQTSCNVLTVI